MLLGIHLAHIGHNPLLRTQLLLLQMQDRFFALLETLVTLTINELVTSPVKELAMSIQTVIAPGHIMQYVSSS